VLNLIHSKKFLTSINMEEHMTIRIRLSTFNQNKQSQVTTYGRYAVPANERPGFGAIRILSEIISCLVNVTCFGRKKS